MRLRVKEQFMCCLLALILFLSGMYVDISPVDSSFLRGSKASVNSTEGSAFENVSYIVSVEEFCTNDMLRQSRTSYVNSDYRKRVSAKRVWKFAIVSIVAEIILLHLFYLRTVTDCRCCDLISSHTAIVRYIQRQDGKK